MTSTTRITIQGLQLWGCHGVLEEERVRPQAFELDVVLTVPQVEEDNLTQTVDYREAIEIIQHINQSRKFRLIEAFAHEIGRALLSAFERMLDVTIRVKKRPAFPVGIHLDHVCVEVHLKRESGSGPTSV